MSFLFSEDYYKVQKKTGLSPFQNMCAYLGGSAIQTVGDNPVTAYRQLVQQFAKDAAGNAVANETNGRLVLPTGRAMRRERMGQGRTGRGAWRRGDM